MYSEKIGFYFVKIAVENIMMINMLRTHREKGEKKE